MNYLMLMMPHKFSSLTGNHLMYPCHNEDVSSNSVENQIRKVNGIITVTLLKDLISYWSHNTATVASCCMCAFYLWKIRTTICMKNMINMIKYLWWLVYICLDFRNFHLTSTKQTRIFEYHNKLSIDENSNVVSYKYAEMILSGMSWYQQMFTYYRVSQKEQHPNFEP